MANAAPRITALKEQLTALNEEQNFNHICERLETNRRYQTFAVNAFQVAQWRYDSKESLGPFKTIDFVSFVALARHVPFTYLQRLQQIKGGLDRGQLNRLLELSRPLAASAWAEVGKAIHDRRPKSGLAWMYFTEFFHPKPKIAENSSVVQPRPSPVPASHTLKTPKGKPRSTKRMRLTLGRPTTSPAPIHESPGRLEERAAPVQPSAQYPQVPLFSPSQRPPATEPPLIPARTPGRRQSEYVTSRRQTSPPRSRAAITLPQLNFTTSPTCYEPAPTTRLPDFNISTFLTNFGTPLPRPTPSPTRISVPLPSSLIQSSAVAPSAMSAPSFQHHSSHSMRPINQLLSDNGGYTGVPRPDLSPY